MLKSRNIRKSAIVAAATIAVTASGMSTASADDGQKYDIGEEIPITVMSDDGVSPQGVAPTCINAVRENVSIQVKNTCDDAWRVKVKLKMLPDTQCKLVEAHSKTNIYTGAGKIDGVETC